MKEMSERAVDMLLNRISQRNEGNPLRISFSAGIREGDSIRKI